MTSSLVEENHKDEKREEEAEGMGKLNYCGFTDDRGVHEDVFQINFNRKGLWPGVKYRKTSRSQYSKSLIIA